MSVTLESIKSECYDELVHIIRVTYNIRMYGKYVRLGRGEEEIGFEKKKVFSLSEDVDVIMHSCKI